MIRILSHFPRNMMANFARGSIKIILQYLLTLIYPICAEYCFKLFHVCINTFIEFQNYSVKNLWQSLLGQSAKSISCNFLLKRLAALFQKCIHSDVTLYSELFKNIKSI